MNGWPETKNMHDNTFGFLVVPVVGWLAVVSLLIVAYLGSLAVEEKRRNRRMDEERERLGLRRA
jgi:hypothetical protein